MSTDDDIPVAIDGTWQKLMGMRSLNGAVICNKCFIYRQISGQASILSRFCKCPNKMHNGGNCKAQSLETVEVYWKFQEPRNLPTL
ncbi:hypothetical protein TNIN_66011 [Trichonephila inaurata madagascariensis]|uniref:Uncharacterized protein n=1 Tax=Trichonephila inaurata madagascariensis TaxID=2747483 RepID=A0A8X6YGN1_9ARAC|nr:hypothetical protein TNIN_66011 [Trichonephila inaurata madagascariensis]